jgi:hypothetical protein
VPQNIYARKIPAPSAPKGSQYELVDSEDEPYREAHLLYKPMSINRMSKKAEDKEYSTIAEFVTDAKSFVHNFHVFHFGNYKKYDLIY